MSDDLTERLGEELIHFLVMGPSVRLRFYPHDYLIPQTVLDGVRGDLAGAAALVDDMKQGKYRIIDERPRGE